MVMSALVNTTAKIGRKSAANITDLPCDTQGPLQVPHTADSTGQAVSDIKQSAARRCVPGECCTCILTVGARRLLSSLCSGDVCGNLESHLVAATRVQAAVLQSTNMSHE